MMIATNVFSWSTEGFTASTRMSSDVSTLLCLISYSFFQDPQEISLQQEVILVLL